MLSSRYTSKITKTCHLGGRIFIPEKARELLPKATLLTVREYILRKGSYFIAKKYGVTDTSIRK